MSDKETKKGYKDTLNLPRTGFPMKANLPQREPEFIKKWDEDDIYGKILKSREAGGKKFILHDGPPYANGHLHVGHVLNKTLKDICIKYYSMNGYRSPYVPGWDCHGLPVEHQLLKEMNITKHEIDQVEFRKKAYKYAMKYVDIQKKEFKRLGIFGEWDNPYLTLTRDYEADILEALADLYDKGYIYKDLKPVNWCARCETALAEAEVEYNDKVSPSIYFKFRADTDTENEPFFFVVWTTTPWTLIANVAVALHPDFEYAFVSSGGEVWILLADMVERVMEKACIENYSVIDKMTGKEVALKIKTARHPFIDRSSSIVLADYVTKEEGTGCVHTAPGHGQDDYITGKKYGLPVIMPVDAFGKFNAEAGEFSGMHIFKANGGIIEKMRDNGTLIISEDIKHSYPYCWRCKEPIIFRATEQWFMNVDSGGLREELSRVINDDVKWVPSVGKERIGSMVKGRPDWCLSRQRYWGVPIPAFECTECGETFTNTDIIKKIAVLTREKGSNVWFERTPEELLPEGVSCPGCGERKFKKEDDILDVWFDSGVSHKAVLESRGDLDFPADLYLEGSDQHRGWFQSSLITSMGLNSCPPFREVLTHGFVVDGEGKKMSKSLGNVIRPQDVMKKYGADILRLWVSSSDYEVDIKLSSEILERLADGYRKIRNTYRFLLSNLYDFDPDKDSVPVESMNEIDRWMLSQLYSLTENVKSFYNNWEFHKVYRSVYDFCVSEVSSFYLDVLKDTIYITSPDSSERRSSQTVIFEILYVLVRLMAPILPFTTEEVWGHMDFKGKEGSVHLSYWPDTEKEMSGWKDDMLDGKWKDIFSLREILLKMLELKREKGDIGSSLEAALSIYACNEKSDIFIHENIGLFPKLFKVSQAFVSDKEEDDMEDVPSLGIKIGVLQARGAKCERCWNFSESVGTFMDHDDLCSRCHEVIIKRGNNGQKKD